MAIPVYCMPGMAASSRLFEHLEWPEGYQVHLLEWDEPHPKEGLLDYAARIAQQITAHNPILIGVSLGGVLMQEVARLLPSYRCVVLISSVASPQELPSWMRRCKKLKLHHILPLARMIRFDFWKHTKRYKKLYIHYIGLSSPTYLAWCARELLDWEGQPLDKDKIIHIHGDKDLVFPIRYIGDCIRVKGGTHIMIVNRFRWFREHFLPIINSKISPTEESTHTPM